MFTGYHKAEGKSEKLRLLWPKAIALRNASFQTQTQTKYDVTMTCTQVW